MFLRFAEGSCSFAYMIQNLYDFIWTYLCMIDIIRIYILMKICIRKWKNHLPMFFFVGLTHFLLVSWLTGCLDNMSSEEMLISIKVYLHIYYLAGESFYSRDSWNTILYIPASSKGCCLNPKGWCIGTPYHPFSTPWKIQVYIFIYIYTGIQQSSKLLLS